MLTDKIFPKAEKGGTVPRIFTEPPSPKPYTLMRELLKDAEKYEMNNDNKIELNVLKILTEYISDYIAQQKAEKKI